MTNQEIALEITKILKPDVDHYTRNHNDGDRFETRKRVYAETYQRKNKKQGVHKTASIPAGMSDRTFSAYIEAA